LPRARTIELTCHGDRPYNLQQFEISTLTSLSLKSYSKHWTLDELKAAFSYFPNLVDMVLELKGLADFDEEVIKRSFIPF
jgi:hypothetical protein